MKEQILHNLRTGEVRGVKVVQIKDYFFEGPTRCCAGGLAILTAHPKIYFEGDDGMDPTGSTLKRIIWWRNYLPWDSGIQWIVAKMNNSGKTFAEIADWLEVNWNP